MLSTQGLWAGRDLYRATSTATWGLGLYGLIQKTGTHVPQWGSNPQLKDHQIFEPDALPLRHAGEVSLYEEHWNEIFDVNLREKRHLG